MTTVMLVDADSVSPVMVPVNRKVYVPILEVSLVDTDNVRPELEKVKTDESMAVIPSLLVRV
jgi:hypothetical protein